MSNPIMMLLAATFIVAAVTTMLARVIPDEYDN